MSGLQTIYTCTKCDAQSGKWSGRCLECGAWGTLVEGVIDNKIKKQASQKISPAVIVDLDKTEKQYLERVLIGIGEVDRVLGGGLIPGSLILLSGEPGIGKSTILAQIADAVKDTIYVSGEESAGQVKDRFGRLNCNLKGLKFIGETNVEKICAAVLEVKPKLVVIDSIQTVYSGEVESEAGSINQIRAATVKFLELAKTNNIAVIIVGHITKDGQVAGPESLEHIVDTVIYLETELKNNYRILRATKNRFGSINEIGIFEMTGLGFKEINNPAAIFIEENDDPEARSGSVISAIMEGTRPFLVEIQALVTKTVFGYPQRKASGFDLNRLQILTQVLTKRTKINLTAQDVLVNIVGGFKVSDPALDLAVGAAIAASLLNQTLDKKTLVLGEVGLGGEVRSVSKLKERLEEAKKLGFKKALAPGDVKVSGLEIVKIVKLADLFKDLLK